MGQNKPANKQAEGKDPKKKHEKHTEILTAFSFISKQLPSGQGLFPVPVPSVLGLPGRTIVEPSATASHALSLCLCADTDCR